MPITLDLYERLTAMISEVIGSVKPQFIPQVQEDLATVEEKMESNAFQSHKVRDEMVKLLRRFESNFLVTKIFVKEPLEVGGTADEGPVASYRADVSEDKEADSPILRSEIGEDVQVPEENLDWISRIEIAEWLRD